MATSSVSEFKTVDVTHDYTIVGYSLSKSLSPESKATSEVFKVGDYSWAIEFYPLAGANHYNGWGFIAIYLKLVDGTRNGRFKFDLTLLDQSIGNDNKIHFTRSQDPLSLPQSSSCWGWSDFMKISDLESSKYLKDDCIRIRCSINILFPATVKDFRAQESPIIPMPPTNINNDLKRLLESGNGCDVIFEVDGQKFNAHKSILAARSPVFNALFFGSLSDPNVKCVSIEDMDPHIFKGLLDFIYCDELSEEIYGASMYQSLLVAADRYDFAGLKIYCQNKLYEDICVETVASTLVIAELMNASVLKSACLEYMVSPENVEEVMESEGLQDIVENHPKLLADVMKANFGGSKKRR